MIPFCVIGKHGINKEQLPFRSVRANVTERGEWSYNPDSPSSICVCANHRIKDEPYSHLMNYAVLTEHERQRDEHELRMYNIEQQHLMGNDDAGL